MSDLKRKSLELHKKYRGKIEIRSKVALKTMDDLAWAYSPGVAEPCKAISKNKEDAYLYTSKSNMVAVVTDGSAVLGLGDIGPEAALPVMEGKAILFKEFAGVDAFPLCLDTKDPEEIIRACMIMAPSFAGINLEDIASPKCVEIERALQKRLDIPVFHDDQHGTAIVTAAALINSCRLTGRDIEDLRVVICGTGAAGCAITRMLKTLGVKTIHGFNIDGTVTKAKISQYDFVIKELLESGMLDDPGTSDTLEELLTGSDLFIGVSVGDIVTPAMIKKMNKNPLVFALANPTPEIDPVVAKEAGAKIIATGRSDHPNQVNNVLAFPGLFRGALDARAANITEPMKLAAAYAIADIIPRDELSSDYVIPSPFDKRVVKSVAKAVIDEAGKSTEGKK